LSVAAEQAVQAFQLEIVEFSAALNNINALRLVPPHRVRSEHHDMTLPYRHVDDRRLSS
jgi:hypothetical protein